MAELTAMQQCNGQQYQARSTTALAETQGTLARQASTLLLNEPPLQVLPSLACAIGLGEAIVLQQLHYWLQRSPHERDGRRWIPQTYQQWQDQLPWWSMRTLKDLLPDLEARGLIVTANHNRLATDRTKWYTINYTHPILATSGTTADDVEGSDEDRPRPISPLLISEPPLQVLPTLASAIGLNSAIVLQQLHYWLQRSRHSRDGRQWIYNTYEQWQQQFPWWSVRTLKRIFHNLETAGLVRAGNFNRSALDRTKWYTVDYAHPTLSDVTAAAYPIRPRCNSGTTQGCKDGPIALGEDDPIGECKSGPLHGHLCPDAGATLACSNQETVPENTTETTIDYDQQQQQGRKSVRSAPDDYVVADLVALLLNRGITPVSAKQLTAATRPEIVTRQVAIYDWLCEQSPDDQRLTPGRLRRMIEEDWNPPPTFVAHAEPRQASGLTQQSRDDQKRFTDAIPHPARTARQAALDALGASAADQVLWERLALDTPRLPTLFRGAIFHAPRGDEPAVLIFPDDESRERAESMAYAMERQRIARRVGGEYRRPWVRVLYLAQDEVLSLLASPPDGGDSAAVLPR